MSSYEKLPISTETLQVTAGVPAPKLERQLSATPRSIGLQGEARRTRRICFGILIASTFVIAGLLSGGWIAGWSTDCAWMWRGKMRGVGRTEGQLVELKNLKRHHHGEKFPKYSTSVDREGQTEIFVYTTAPIVNPGGYTIGTFTGYREMKTKSTSSTIASPTSHPVPSASTTLLTSSHPSPTSQLISTSLRNTTPFSSSSHTTLSSSSQSSSTHLPKENVEFDFEQVDAHLLFKRGILLEGMGFEESVTSTPTTSASTEEEESGVTLQAGTIDYSYRIDSEGSVQTLVKTTRPIINPGGYTIGTLEGAYVPVPTSAEKGRKHVELRKREA